MTKISGGKIKDDYFIRMVNEFWHITDDLKGDSLAHFLKNIFTPTEKIMFAKRLVIIKMLRRGSGYEEIRNKLKVNDSTIYRMSRIIRFGDSKFLKLLDKHMSSEDKRYKTLRKKKK